MIEIKFIVRLAPKATTAPEIVIACPEIDGLKDRPTAGMDT